MSNTIFRTRVEPAAEKPVEMIKDADRVAVDNTKVDPPFTDYERVTGKPYAVDHFELGKYWNVDNVYTKEVGTISEYLTMLVDRGEIDNSLKSVKHIMKSIAKTAGIEITDTLPVKVGKTAAYMRFLLDTDHIKLSQRKYGNY